MEDSFRWNRRILRRQLRFPVFILVRLTTSLLDLCLYPRVSFESESSLLKSYEQAASRRAEALLAFLSMQISPA
jgi:hypothetical protein